MASTLIVKKKNRNFVMDLKQNHTQIGELKGDSVKLRNLKSLSFLMKSNSSLSKGLVLRRTASDSLVSKLKINSKQLRKIEKQLLRIKNQKHEQADICYDSMNNPIVSKQLNLQYLTFPLQFDKLFSLGSLSLKDIKESSMFGNLGTFFNRNEPNFTKKESKLLNNFDKACNTSYSKFSKEIQTDSKDHVNVVKNDKIENTKTQNVRVKKKTKRTQTEDLKDSGHAVVHQTKKEPKKMRDSTVQTQTSVPNVVKPMKQTSSVRISSNRYLDENIFSFSKHNSFMDTCGFELNQKFKSSLESINKKPPQNVYRVDSMKVTPKIKSKPSLEGIKPSKDKQLSNVKQCRAKCKEPPKEPPKKGSKMEPSKAGLEKKKFHCNTATMDQVCSVETKKSIDLVSLRNLILKFSPLCRKNSCDTVNKEIKTTRSKETDQKTGKKINRNKTKASEDKPRKIKRKIKIKQSKDQNVGTDSNEVQSLVNNSSTEDPLPYFNFKPIIFNQSTERASEIAYKKPFPKRRRSDPFKNGLIKKPSKQCLSKFIGRRGNVFDYVSCITSTSSTIYSSADSIKKIFTRSRMSILTVESDYSSLLKVISNSTDQNISVVKCEDLMRQDVIKKVEEYNRTVEEPVEEMITVEKSVTTDNIKEEAIVFTKLVTTDISVEAKGSKSSKKFASKILKTLSKLSHRKYSSVISESKLLKKSSDKFYKKKYKDILKEHKLHQEHIALKNVSSCKMQRQYVFNIVQTEGSNNTPVVINLNLDNLSLSQKVSSKSNRLKTMFNCLVAKSSTEVYEKCLDVKTGVNKQQYMKYSDEIIAKEELRTQCKNTEVMGKISTTCLVHNASEAELLDELASLEDIRILFKNTLHSETELSDNESVDKSKHTSKDKDKIVGNLRNLIELKVNPASLDGKQCFASPISIYVDPKTEVIGENAKYSIDCLESVIVDKKGDASCHNKNLRIQISLILQKLEV